MNVKIMMELHSLLNIHHKKRRTLILEMELEIPNLSLIGRKIKVNDILVKLIIYFFHFHSIFYKPALNKIHHIQSFIYKL